MKALTTRQSQIIKLMLEGLNGVQIAEILGLSKSGIRGHRDRIYRKFDIDASRFDRQVRLIYLLHKSPALRLGLGLKCSACE